MCDEQTQQDVDEYHRKHGELNRRSFGKMAIAAGLAAAFPPLANALDTVDSSVNITTPDGEADCYFVHPARGEYPGILIWPDILGLRPAFQAMAKRLAQSGYSVLVVNPFYRVAKAPCGTGGLHLRGSQNSRNRAANGPSTEPGDGFC